MYLYNLKWHKDAEAEFMALLSQNELNEATDILSLADYMAEKGFDLRNVHRSVNGSAIYKRQPRRYLFMVTVEQPPSGPAPGGDMRILAIGTNLAAVEANAIKRI
ncbi:MAG TPA: hypothetical protein VJU59_30260 [Paraburkholderia sp.]|uniref:hypothetical protein n=1 Tax=Paraburkholderia sp. TaxID=1926495 RepID=UPI002B48150D|nr:hypothetical protein [Paraburkholderia sp.]HKR43910.1 hypothetical protein [Paraburkholderia sp.]